MPTPPQGFQRARRPEQVEARRRAILAAALAMLEERRVADISLRDLSDRAGMAKSNVLRYFDSREAIFLEVLDRTWTTWLNDLATDLPAAPTGSGPYAREIALATAIAESAAARPLMCELLSVMGAVLERNISLDFARTFKVRATDSITRLAELVRTELPRLTAPAATHFASTVSITIAGLWPYANPTPEMATASAELGHPPPNETFTPALTETLTNQLIGLTARGT